MLTDHRRGVFCFALFGNHLSIKQCGHCVVLEFSVDGVRIPVGGALFSHGGYGCSCSLPGSLSVYSKNTTVVAAGNMKHITFCVPEEFYPEEPSDTGSLELKM